MADLAAPVALGTSRAAATAAAAAKAAAAETAAGGTARVLGAVAGLIGDQSQQGRQTEGLGETHDMALLAALVARLGLRLRRAVTGDMALQSAW